MTSNIRRTGLIVTLSPRITILSLTVLILLSGCSSYYRRIAPVRDLAAQGKLEKALSHVAEIMESGDLLYHLESGILLHLMGRYEESDAELDSAELLIEELYTQSLSRKGLSYLLNEEVEAYEGQPFERFLINYYRALNHLHMGDLSGALVEARKIDQKWAEQTEMEEDLFEQGRIPIVEYFSGLLHEEGNELNDALVSLRLTEEAYSQLSGQSSVQKPVWLTQDLKRVAWKGGFTEFIEERSFLDIDSKSFEKSTGEVVFFFENGWIPIKTEKRIRIPLLETETDIDDDGVILLAGTLHNRYQTHLMHGYWFPEKVKIAYWLEVALPVFPPLYSPVIQSARISSGSVSVETMQLEDLGEAARATFEAQESGIVLRAIVRAFLKYLGHRVVEKRGGELAGFLANVIGVATEKADTRAWTTLPREIQMARLTLPEGTHSLSLECLGVRGEVVEFVELGNVEVKADQKLFINWRSLLR